MRQSFPRQEHVHASTERSLVRLGARRAERHQNKEICNNAVSPYFVALWLHLSTSRTTPTAIDHLPQCVVSGWHTIVIESAVKNGSRRRYDRESTFNQHRAKNVLASSNSNQSRHAKKTPSQKPCARSEGAGESMEVRARANG